MQNYKAQVGQQSFSLSEADVQKLDLVERAGSFHLLDQDKKFKIELISAEEKTLILKVNEAFYTVQISDTVDQMVQQMGLDKPAEVKMTDVKAPMPGLILDILVEAGTKVSAGDSLLVLEAMKMENVIKAVGEGVVQSIEKEKGATVEKSEVIIIME